jgi:hypothetical protein
MTIKKPTFTAIDEPIVTTGDAGKHLNRLPFTIEQLTTIQAAYRTSARKGESVQYYLVRLCCEAHLSATGEVL